jgi:hypothetical protein
VSEDYYGGRPQNWASSFDISDAKTSTFDLLSHGILRIGLVETSFDIEALPWKYSPEAHPSWRLRFLSLKWLCPTIYSCVFSGADVAPRMELVSAVLQRWITWEREASDDDRLDHWNGHTVALRATSLVSASTFINADWLKASMEKHGDWLLNEDNWDGPWNHGLMQSIALLGVALRLDRRDSIEVAVDRIRRSLDAMIDSQGCINEQATAYARFIYNLLTQVSRVFEENKIELPDYKLGERQRLLAIFMAHATEPNGTFVQLGDSLKTAPMSVKDTELEYVTSGGLSGPIPAASVAVYDQGFIFGRSGWGLEREFQDESFYSLRFGPQRVIHGHNDHMSLTWFESGRNIVIDSGHNGYKDDEFRRHLRSVDAHNVLSIRGLRHDWSANTRLVRQEVSDQAQFFELCDEAYSGVTRSRSVLAVPKGPIITVDRTDAGNTTRIHDQLWHLAPDHQLVSIDGGHATFKTPDDDGETHLISHVIEASDEIFPPGSRYWIGSLSPHQGWYSGHDQENVAAPALAFTHDSAKLFMVTCIARCGKGEFLGHSLRSEGSGWFILRIHTLSGSWVWRISPGGYLALRSRPKVEKQ